jgi:D-arginine dehydrogenase
MPKRLVVDRMDAVYTDTFNPATSGEAPATADVVIVGGGIAGVSLAAGLAARARVVVLEAEPALFRHTSSRSAQQVQPSYGPPAIRQLTRTSLEMLRMLDAEAATPVLSPRTLYVIALDEAFGLGALAQRTPGLRATGGAEVESAFPGLLPGIVAEAAADDAASEVDVNALLTRYAQLATAGGVEFVTGARFTGATRSGSATRLETTAGNISAPVVVNAAGAWADDVARLFGAERRGLLPTRRSVILATPTGSPIGADWPMIYDAAGTVYFRPRGADVLASPLEDEPSIPEDSRPRADVIAETLLRVNAMTSFDLTTAHEAWTGLRTAAADDLPVVGFDGDVEGLYWLAGQGGYGIQTSAALSILAAADIVGDERPLAADDQAAFASLSPDRASITTEKG